MFETIEVWNEEISTKEKERQILNYLSINNMDDVDNINNVSNFLFDEDNLPIANPNISSLFESIGIDVIDFLDFLNN